MKLITGGTAKTTNCQIEYCWLCESESANRLYDRQVAQWIAKNEKALNKALPHQAVRLLMEQFPVLTYVEVKDYCHRMAKGGK